MSGYKRVNFYELCRLCATNQQKEKTHIFQEEGRKIQLQNKIQSCLSLKVCENDFLPKVVCSQCLRTLEECSAFRKECYTSETMLSSYFNNFRYTEDFKKSGKVYIKDTSPKIVTTELPVHTSTTTVSNNCSINVVPNVNASMTQEAVPYYTLHLPSVVSPEAKTVKDAKLVSQPQIVYNLNAIKTVVPNLMKTTLSDAVSNVTVNPNGEIITIAPLMDMDSLFSQNVMQKPQKKIPRKQKITDTGGKSTDDPDIIKIDLTHPEVDLKRDTLEKLKMQQNKVPYTVKLDEGNKSTYILNHTDVNINPNSNNNLPRSNFNPSQSVILNSNSKLFGSNINGNRLPKTSYSSFNNVINTSVTTPTSNIPITTDSISNLNSDISQNVNISINGFNATQNVQYSISGTKPESIQTETGIGTMPDAITFTNLFSSANTGVVTSQNQTGCSVMRNCTNAVSNQMQSFPSLNVAPSFPTANGGNQEPVFTSPPQAVEQPQQPMSKQEGNTIKRHSCDICYKMFKRREHLYQHVKLHTGFRPFKCENCNKSFMRKEHLLRHMTSHSGQKNYTCNICEKSFSRNDNLLKHKKIHNKQNSFTCEVCQKQFVMEHYYLAHKLTHDTEKCNLNPMWGLLKAVQ